MPITKSAKKALRQSLTRQKRNLKRKETIKDIIKKIKKLVAQGKTEEAKTLLPQAQKSLDKATKNYLHRRAASRKKSRLAALINKTSK